MKLSCGSEVNISDFDILKSISQGGSSKVYLSRKRGTDDLYAIKVMSKAEIRGMDMEKRVVQERQVRLYWHFGSLSLPSPSNHLLLPLPWSPHRFSVSWAAVTPTLHDFTLPSDPASIFFLCKSM
jgi:serine/threonine protein kinase